jgi:hypothetical protein
MSANSNQFVEVLVDINQATRRHTTEDPQVVKILNFILKGGRPELKFLLIITGFLDVFHRPIF